MQEDNISFEEIGKDIYHNAPGFAEHAKTLGFTVEVK